MTSYLETLAFALLIGGQFLAAIVLISKRDSIYGDMRSPNSIAINRNPAKAAGTAWMDIWPMWPS